MRWVRWAMGRSAGAGREGPRALSTDSDRRDAASHAMLIGNKKGGSLSTSAFACIDRLRSTGSDQNVMLQLSMRPVSPLALSFTRRFHVPFNTSEDRFTL